MSIEIKNKQYMEKMILHYMVKDEMFFFTVVGSVKSNYFEYKPHGDLFNVIKNHYENNSTVPDLEILKSTVTNDMDENKKEDTFIVIEDLEHLSIDIEKHKEWMVTKTDEWIKNNAMRTAILNSVDLLNAGDFGGIEDNIRDALLSGIKSDIGTVYFENVRKRIERMLQFMRNRISTGYTELDRIMNGGIYTPSLLVFLGRVNLGKSLLLTNLTHNFSMNGLNCAIVSLEIPEAMIAHRLDAHLTGLDINRLYMEKEHIMTLYNTLNGVKSQCGEVFIKEFPPAMTTIYDIRRYLKELSMMGKKIDIILVDYLNLLATEGKTEGMYSDKKKIAEQLRALSYQWNAPVITVSQLNRSGYFAEFDQLDLEHSSESMGTAATADFVGIIGKDMDSMVYLNELDMKIPKNRMGAKDGLGNLKFWLNPFSLRLYDNEKDFIDSFDKSGGQPKLMDKMERNKGEKTLGDFMEE